MPGKIAIAYEDVITSDSDLWANFAKYARLEGHTIYIIGEGPPYSVTDGLEYHGLFSDLHYDFAISLFSFLTKKGEDMYFNETLHKWICRNPEIWAASKGRWCHENHISLMIEDNYLFHSAFKFIPTRLFMVCKAGARETIKSTVKLLHEKNEWFDDYEGEFNVHSM